VRKVLAGLTILTILELVVIIEVAEHLGVVNTLGLLLLVAVAGILIVKAQGLRTVRRVLDVFQLRRIPGATLADGALIALAGVLLVVPGFLTAIPGVLLLFPRVRTAVRRYLSARWTRRFVFTRVSPVPPDRPQLPQ